MVDFGVNRTHETVPNLPQNSALHYRAVEKPGQKKSESGSTDVKGAANVGSGNSVKQMLDKIARDPHIKEEAENSFQMSEERLKALLEEMNTVSKMAKSDVSFEYSKELGQMVVNVLDENNVVVRKIPPEYLIELRGRLREQIGQLLDREI